MMNASKPMSKPDLPMSFKSGLYITLRVGKGDAQEDFLANEAYLFKSEFFTRAMNGHWLESKARIVTLPEDNPREVQLYLTILHYGELPQEVIDSDSIVCILLREHDLHGDLCLAYVLAEKFQDISTKNAIIKMMWTLDDKHRFFPPSDVLKVIYDGTLEGNPMRRYLVDVYSLLSFRQKKSEVRNAPLEFLHDWEAAEIEANTAHEKYKDTKQSIETYLQEVPNSGC